MWPKVIDPSKRDKYESLAWFPNRSFFGLMRSSYTLNGNVVDCFEACSSSLKFQNAAFDSLQSISPCELETRYFL